MPSEDVRCCVQPHCWVTDNGLYILALKPCTSITAMLGFLILLNAMSIHFILSILTSTNPHWGVSGPQICLMALWGQQSARYCWSMSVFRQMYLNFGCSGNTGFFFLAFCTQLVLPKDSKPVASCLWSFESGLVDEGQHPLKNLSSFSHSPWQVLPGLFMETAAVHIVAYAALWCLSFLWNAVLVFQGINDSSGSLSDASRPELANRTEADADGLPAGGWFTSLFAGRSESTQFPTLETTSASPAPSPPSPTPEGTDMYRQIDIAVDITRKLVDNYMSLVQRNISDLVPKAIMHFLVHRSRRGLQQHLIGKLYKYVELPQFMKSLLLLCTLWLEKCLWPWSCADWSVSLRFVLA